MKNYDIEVDGIFYKKLSNNTVEVERPKKRDMKAIVIPSSITVENVKYTVAKISSYAFSDCRALESILISERVKKIEMNAFLNCVSLVSITIPDSVSEIESAFTNCKKLETITLGKRIKNIEVDFCDSLKKIVCNSDIPPRAMWGSHIKEQCIVYVPKESIHTYKNNPFWKDIRNIASLEEMQYNTHEQKIESSKHHYDFEIDGIFYRKLSDNSVEVTYADSIFNSRTVYKGDIIIPSTIIVDNVTYNVTKIGEYSFWGCEKLKSIDIPGGITKIEESAFNDCPELESINIRKWVVYSGTTFNDKKFSLIRLHKTGGLPWRQTRIYDYEEKYYEKVAEIGSMSFPYMPDADDLLHYADDFDFFQTEDIGIEVDGEMVGFINMFCFNNASFLHLLAIHPDYQKRGLCTILLDYVIKTTTKPIITIADVEKKENLWQKVLLKKYGFVMTEETVSLYGQGEKSVFSKGKFDRWGIWSGMLEVFEVLGIMD